MASLGEFNTDVNDMYAVHNALTGALDQADELVASATTPERVELIATFYDNVLEFLHCHHAGEDEIVYPLLEQRCGHERATLERIDDQHKLLFKPMDEAWAAIAAWRTAPSPESAKAVMDGIDGVDATLTPHLREEERTVLPLATKWLSAEEWGQLPGHAMAMFSKDKPWLPLGLVREQLPEEVRVAMLEAMPPEMQQMWTEQFEPAYNAFMAEVRA
jgi:hemerythrin-like domain-containing protein